MRKMNIGKRVLFLVLFVFVDINQLHVTIKLDCTACKNPKIAIFCRSQTIGEVSVGGRLTYKNKLKLDKDCEFRDW